ncbi:MAG TPA: hypothetical protein VFB62_09195 [Polyangiaceae bacterium]|jgi:hypothetical protein|nr:hypothetical protein [Polyangiaceae bacterium]
MNTRRLLGIALALCTLAIPAAAQAGPVHDALRADRLPPPGQATVRIVPPRGGTVMLYRGGQVVGWFMRPGFAQVDARVPYGIMATRGTAVLFHAGITMNPGLTELVWGEGNTPSIGWLPGPNVHAHAHQHGAHAQPATPATATRPRSASLVQEMRRAPNDARRLALFKRHLVARRPLSSKDKTAALRTFHSKNYRTAAARLLRNG